MSEKIQLIGDTGKNEPFYGTYKEQSFLDRIHWENKKKRHQLCIITVVIVILTVLAIGIVLAITLPSLLENTVAHNENILDPVNPAHWDTVLSNSKLGIYNEAGISSEDQLCSDIGKDILQNLNGTAVDAAVGTTLCLGVVRPQSCGLGGGLFMMIYDNTGQIYGLNGRETVPANTDPRIYDKDPSLSLQGGLAVGVPGELNALWAAHQRFGNVDWADLVNPAKHLAIDGFRVSRFLARKLKSSEKVLQDDPVLKSEFINPATGKVWVEGDTLKRPRLGRTLEIIETEGVGVRVNRTDILTTNILLDLESAGSPITESDLINYNPQWTESIRLNLSSLHNLTMYSLPFPSSGPVVTMGLGILEKFGKKTQSKLTPEEQSLDIHYLIETLKFAESHRSRIGDLNFDIGNELHNLMEKMISDSYIDEIFSKVKANQNHTQNNISYYGPIFSTPEDHGTSHISIIGPNGDAVSLTTSINLAFGAGFMGNSTGIIFNNQLNDFSFPNQSDIFGLVPNPLNFMEPGKQPASSMSPIIVINGEGKPVLVSGGAGGGAIISAVISATWRALYRDLNIKESIDFPRFIVKMGNGAAPSPTVLYEYGVPAYVIQDLESRGHVTQRIGGANSTTKLGNVNSVCRTKESQRILTNADYRKSGGSNGF